MIPKKVETGGIIQRKSTKERGIRKDTERKREREKKKSETRKERESTGLRGRGDTRKVDLVIGWESMKGRGEKGIERENMTEVNTRTGGMTKKDERRMEFGSIWKRWREEVRLQYVLSSLCKQDYVHLW